MDLFLVMDKQNSLSRELKYFAFTLLVFCSPPALSLPENLLAQVVLKEDSVRIGKITVQGNSKTRTEIILRELEFKSGDLVYKTELQQARKRLENLNIFNRVVFQFEDAGTVKNLNILVWERWYLYPTVIFQVNEHDWKKLSYGLGLFHANFRGRAEHLWGAGWLGYNPGLNLAYSNRWFAGRHRLYTRLSLLSQRIASKTLLFPGRTERHRSFTTLIGKRYGIYWYTDLEFKFEMVRAAKVLLWQHRQAQDELFTSTVKIQIDTRDLWEYPARGRKVLLAFSRTFLLNKKATFDLWRLDWREYHSLKGVILAARIFVERTHHELPVYAHRYLGYEERIRGHFHKILEGDHRLFSSLEIRLPLIRETYFQFPAHNWFLVYFQQLKFGLYLTVFHDAGAVWWQNRNLQPQNWYSGSGVGLNLLLPYSNVFRLEYAFADSGEGELIADVNLAF